MLVAEPLPGSSGPGTVRGSDSHTEINRISGYNGLEFLLPVLSSLLNRASAVKQNQYRSYGFVLLVTMFSGLLSVTPASALPVTGPATAESVPDLTRGGAIPEGADHDWTLGATGARGWMYSDRLVTRDARQIAVTKVELGSPADGVLAVDDVILGVGEKPFSYDPRTELGLALTHAESEAGSGQLELIRWRSGRTESVMVKLPVLGTYSATAPYECPKSRRILEQGCEALAKKISDPGYRQNAITRSLNALALLASGDRQFLPLVRKEAQWAAGYSADSFQTWYYGYVIMLLAEYVEATGDDSVMPGLRRLALEAARGQSVVGSWGHKLRVLMGASVATG